VGRGAQQEGRAPAAAGQGGAIVRVFKGRNPFRLLFGSSRREDFLARYVLREHEHGRALAEILEDPYVRNWSTPEERRRLLDLPEVVAALGENAVEDLRQAVRAEG
jgi:hypothetical protein